MTRGLNLESCLNQLSKFGYHQTPARLLSDSWQTLDRLLTYSLYIPDWLLTDSQYTHIKYTLRNKWSCNQVSIWRAVQISSPNLVTVRPTPNPATEIWRLEMTSCLNLERCTNQLSKFGYHQKPDRLLTDIWQTPDRLLTYPWLTLDWLSTDFQQTNIKPRHQVSIWRAVQISSPNLESFSNKLSKFGSSPNFVTINLPKIVLTDWHQTPKQSMRFMIWWL